MSKKVMLVLLSVALVTIIAVNETLANEVAGAVKNLFKAITGLVEGPTSNADAFEVEIISTSDKVLAPSNYSGDELDFATASSVVTSTTCVVNKRQADAYVRICIAMKKDEVLRHQGPGFDSGAYLLSSTTDLDGYTLYVLDYQGVLAGGQSTPPITMKAALTKETDNEDMARLGDSVMQVEAFAIEKAAFDHLNTNGETRKPDEEAPTPAQALTMALGDISTFNPFE